MGKYLIFISVGTQLPFDRLVKAVESKYANSDDVELYFQVGRGGYKPSVGVVKEELSEKDYFDILRRCDLFVSHCGTGSMVAALDYDKPLVCMPRRAGLGEHRNDHQLNAAGKIDPAFFSVAFNNEQLINSINFYLVNRFFSRSFSLDIINDAFIKGLDFEISTLLEL